MVLAGSFLGVPSLALLLHLDVELPAGALGGDRCLRNDTEVTVAGQRSREDCSQVSRMVRDIVELGVEALASSGCEVGLREATNVRS